MNIYIPDIKLAKDEPGAFQVIVMYVGADRKLRAECEGTHEVTIVQPHGRLVDAWYIRDAIIQKWMDKAGDSHMYKCGMEDAYEVIRNAPTIIPAEPLNEEVNE